MATAMTVIPVLLWGAALLFAIVAIVRGERPLTYRFVLDRLLRYIFLFPLGVQALLLFASHMLLPEDSANAMGWAPSPFQYEVGVASLGLAFASFYAAFGTFAARAATALVAAGFLAGAGFGHILDLLAGDSPGPANSGPLLVTDFLTPIVLLLLLLISPRRPAYSERVEPSLDALREQARGELEPAFAAQGYEPSVAAENYEPSFAAQEFEPNLAAPQQFEPNLGEPQFEPDGQEFEPTLAAEDYELSPAAQGFEAVDEEQALVPEAETQNEPATPPQPPVPMRDPRPGFQPGGAGPSRDIAAYAAEPPPMTAVPAAANAAPTPVEVPAPEADMPAQLPFGFPSLEDELEAARRKMREALTAGPTAEVLPPLRRQVFIAPGRTLGRGNLVDISKK